MATENDSIAIFDNLSTKFSCFLYGRPEKQRDHISRILNEFNELNYKLPLVTNNNVSNKGQCLHPNLQTYFFIFRKLFS